MSFSFYILRGEYAKEALQHHICPLTVYFHCLAKGAVTGIHLNIVLIFHSVTNNDLLCDIQSLFIFIILNILGIVNLLSMVGQGLAEVHLMISYKPFYQTLFRKNITEYQLIYNYGFSANTLHRMKHGRNITLFAPFQNVILPILSPIILTKHKHKLTEPLKFSLLRQIRFLNYFSGRHCLMYTMKGCLSRPM